MSPTMSNTDFSNSKKNSNILNNDDDISFVE